MTDMKRQRFSPFSEPRTWLERSGADIAVALRYTMRG
jgi:hypothetical protein